MKDLHATPHGEAVGHLAMAAEATALRNRGQDIVDLSVGEPDFDTPEHVKAAGATRWRVPHQVHADRGHGRAEGCHLDQAPARQRPRTGARR